MKNIEELHAPFEYEEDFYKDPIFILTKLRVCRDRSFLELKDNPAKHVWISIELPTKILLNTLLVIMYNELPFPEGIQGRVNRYTDTYCGEVTLCFEDDRIKIVVKDENFVNLTPKVASYYLKLIQEALD